MLETLCGYKLITSVYSFECYSGSLGFNKVNSSLINSGLKKLSQAIPPSFPIRCFLCCSTTREQSLVSDNGHRERSGEFLFGISLGIDCRKRKTLV